MRMAKDHFNGFVAMNRIARMVSYKCRIFFKIGCISTGARYHFSRLFWTTFYIFGIYRGGTGLYSRRGMWDRMGWSQVYYIVLQAFYGIFYCFTGILRYILLFYRQFGCLRAKYAYLQAYFT